MKQSDRNALEENQRITTFQKFGTMTTANYILPRSYYYSLSSSDDFMALMLLTIDQMRMQCEELVRDLSKGKNIYRQGVKKICSELYCKVNGVRSGICVEVERAMMSNMTTDEQMGFGLMASHIDEVIGDDMKKLSNSLFIEVGKAKVKNQAAFTKVLSAHLFGLVAANIIDRCLEKAKGSHYMLCIEPMSAEARTRAYTLDGRDTQRMTNVTLKLICALANGQNFNIPYTNDIENGVVIVCNKICNIINIYNACLEAGIQVGNHSAKDLTELVEKINRKKGETGQNIEKKSPDQKTLKDYFSSKGWIVKAS